MNKKTKNKKKSNKAVKIIISVFMIYLLLMATIFTIGTIYLNKINRFDDIVPVPPEEEFFDVDEDATGDDVDPEEIIWDPGMDVQDEDLLNILLVGQDRREGEGRQRSDSMILCSFNAETNELAMVSFLRDLYVQIPGYSDNRLNAAYVFGGFPLLKETLYLNFGVTVDGCVEVDFSGFKNIIDTVGGVDIKLTEAEAKCVGGGATEGMNHLDGEHALTYARIRYIDSDFGRTARQRNVINAVINKMRDRSVSELLSFVDAVLPMITTDMSNAEITKYALQYAPALRGLQVSTHHVPGEGRYRYAKVRGMSVLIPDLAGIRKDLREDYLPL